MVERGPTRRKNSAWLEIAVSSVAVLSLTAPALARRLERRLPSRFADTIAAGSLAVTAWGVIAFEERRRPHRRDWLDGSVREISTDVFHATVTSPLVAAATMATSSIVSTCVRHGRTRRSYWPRRAPLAVRTVVAITIAECVHYSFHRASHSIPTLWRFHRYHHDIDRLYLLNSLRQHPVDIGLLGVLQMVPLELLGIDRSARTAFYVFKGIHGQLQHANVQLDSRRLDWLLSTPLQHRIHHGPSPSDGNSNFGTVFSWPDRVFGTLRLSEVTERPVGTTPGGRSSDWIGP